MCGIVNPVAQRDIAEILLKVYVVWNTVAMTLPVLVVFLSARSYDPRASPG